MGKNGSRSGIQSAAASNYTTDIVQAARLCLGMAVAVQRKNFLMTIRKNHGGNNREIGDGAPSRRTACIPRQSLGTRGM